ncbi:uracil-DNA glycosylase [Candidatus Saccharibacteria bacterium]|nr:MAG: uracil-DNA glycosylase [Candidatus Saccharibacteria bacterium]
MKFATWREFVENEAQKSYFRQLMNRVDAEREKYDIYPERKDMFSCFGACPLDKLKVVIIGQDPYHGPGQAHGMSFSVRPGVAQPPSLKNIFKELNTDIGCDIPESGFLWPWGERGVLMMNTSWSVRRSQPGSHANYGWMEFSENLLEMLNQLDRPIVFILWGAHAQKIGQKIDNPSHLKIASAHPSPFSANRGFFGSKPFSRANQFLKENDLGEIDWCLDPKTT